MEYKTLKFVARLNTPDPICGEVVLLSVDGGDASRWTIEGLNELEINATGANKDELDRAIACIDLHTVQ